MDDAAPTMGDLGRYELLAERLRPAAGAMMDAVEAHLQSLADPGGRVDVAAEFLLVDARR